MANSKGTSVISNPKGGGAQGGLGEKFSPDLFTGTGNFSVPIALPPGRNGFQPELNLSYSSGNGNGIFGLGWAMGTPGVTRKTSKGIPIYEDKSDIFILSGAEDLVPTGITQTVTNGIEWQQTTYRPRTEGLFARIIRHKKTNGEHYWEVSSKDGLVSYYGTPGTTQPSNTPQPGLNEDGCVLADPAKRDSIFAWHLSKTVDPFGNEIVYEYERNLVATSTYPTASVGETGRYYDQLYIKTIKYCQYKLNVGPVQYLAELHFNYENRPDPFSSYKQGFEVRTTRRCANMQLFTNAQNLLKTKTYHFKYKSRLPLNGASLLESINVEGHHTESEFMPPLEFSYSDYKPTKRDLKEIKGPIPIMSLAQPGFEIVDLSGNGLPDILQLNGTARYWTNKGNGEFSEPRPLNIAPGVQLGLPGVQMIDANGDGRSDLMVNTGTIAGYYPGAFNNVWDTNSFKPYKNNPSFSFTDPEVQLIDLDGDGITDVLRNGKRFECFYNDPEKGFYKVKTADKTFTDFSFSDPRIRFADMTGDGLQDIVLISSGRVQYWPNMGYGRFGNKINMQNAPVFPEQYNPAQVLLGDLDGDGQADIAFVENNKVTLYVNQSGNAFSEPVTINNTAPVENAKALRLTDIMGTGQAGILWSLLSTGGTSGKMFFLDFTHGNKPYILEQMNNNMGSLTRVAYGSSVYHYLRDQKKPETRWKTELPFPVQVVNKVEVLDLLSGGKLVTEYNYHNGYWDGAEREFRGFAQVDSYDTETFERFNTQDLFAAEAPYDTLITTSASSSLSEKEEHYNPPTLTKSWFYIGVVGDGFSRWKEPDFGNEYWSEDEQMLTRPEKMVQLLNNLPRRARRDALRTLRGSLLRSELYALDNSALQNRPYTVTENLMSLRVEFDPSLAPDFYWTEKNAYWSGGGYVFFPFNVAQRSTQYERGKDPMHSFSFTKDYDAYGQPLAQMSAGVPRGCNPTSGGMGNYLCTYNTTDYIYANNPAISPQYMVNRVCRSIGYDASLSATSRSVLQLRDDVFSGTATLPIITCTINYYDGTAFNGLSYGIIGNYGAQVRSETLIVTGAILDKAYGSSSHPQCFESNPNWTTGYPGAFVGKLQNADTRLGYKDRRTGNPWHIPGWYSESERVMYDFQNSSLPTYKQVGRVLQSRNVFDSWQEIEYDTYCLMPIISKQYLGTFPSTTSVLETQAIYDYRVMQPKQIIDVNGNKSAFDFSPLGLLRATALIGKGTEGDYTGLSGDFDTVYTASIKMEYDFFAFKNSGNPAWVKTISREKHYQQSATSNTISKVEYSDGFGRLLQTRVQAEDVVFAPAFASNSPGESFGDSGLPINQGQNANAVGSQRGYAAPLNVVVSGWKIYNNKGKVVEQYEPFFDKGFDYALPELMGVKIKMYYDPLGRVVKTVNPDNSTQWVIYGTPNNLLQPADPCLPTFADSYTPSSWVNFSYDANDLAILSNITLNNVPQAHHFTPKSTEVDALGRTIKTREFFDNSNYANTIDMNYLYDIKGNLLLVKDAYNKNVFEYVYDLRAPEKDTALPPLKTIHIDKGESKVLFDASGKTIESIDNKGAKTLSAYDTINRPTHGWACNKTGDSITLRNYTVYGDSAGLNNPETTNLKTKAYKTYDEAGLIEIPEYDFKGNALTKKRRVLSSATLKTNLNNYTTFNVDWTGLPNILDTFVFESNMVYDALNRINKLTLPQNVNNSRKDIVPVYNNAGALESVTYDGTTYVEHIAYNARGQRMFIAFNNGVMTRYVYHPLTFRLLRQRSERYTKTQAGNVITYAYQSGTNKQDDKFNYDLIGNIVNTFTRVSDCGIGSNPDELDRTFKYDPLNRLTYADGREATTHSSANNYIYTDAPAPGAPNASNVRAYSRTYSYDKLGNVLNVVQGGVNGFTRSFNYNNNANTLNEIRDNNNTLIENFTYDANGNQITAGNARHYKWNHADQLICYKNQAGTSAPTVFTQYDYAGHERVSKMVRTGNNYERSIYIDGIFEYINLETSTATYEKNYIQVMDDKSRIAEIRVGAIFPGDINDNITYILENQIGSSVARLDTNGTVIDKEEYYPFGDSSLRTFTYKRYRYVSKERDSESGLYYYGARYYAAWTCRFISIDPLAADYPFYTPYNYAGNKPINKIDIDGMQEGNKDGGGTAQAAPTNRAIPAPEAGAASKDQAANPTTQKTQTDQVGAWYKNEKTGRIAWSEKKSKLGEPVSLKGSKDTWTNIGHNNSEEAKTAVMKHNFSLYMKEHPPLASGRLDPDYGFDLGAVLAVPIKNILGPAVNYLTSKIVTSASAKAVTQTVEQIAAKGGSQGGLNLFKWGAEQTGKSTGWKAGDYMLHLPNKGTPALNWKANYGALRSEMNLGKPIFDSYRLPNGNLIPTGGFLNAERYILQTRGWMYSPGSGAWMPPIR